MDDVKDLTDKLLAGLADESHHLGQDIEDLDDELETTDDEARARTIKLTLPTLRARRLELDQKFAALEAVSMALPAPTADLVDKLKRASSMLAAKAARNVVLPTLITAADALINAAQAGGDQ